MTAFGRSRGFYNPLSLFLYVLVAAGVCLVLLRFRSLARLTKSRIPAWLLYGAVLVNVVVQSQKPGLIYPSNMNLLAAANVMGYALVVLAVLQCPPLFNRIPRRGRGAICVLCAATAAAMLLMIPLISPHPAIDVVTVQEEAATSLRAGENPYQKAEYTNIYGPGTPWYPDGRMNSYPYPPLTMLAAMIGDPRWMPTLGHLFGALTVFLIVRKTLPLLEGFWLSFLVLYPPNARFRPRARVDGSESRAGAVARGAGLWLGPVGSVASCLRPDVRVQAVDGDCGASGLDALADAEAPDLPVGRRRSAW